MSYIESKLRILIRPPIRAILLLCTACSAPLHATSVAEVSLAEMVENSALVFEGDVIDRQVRETGNGIFRTHVTFAVIDVIKGNVKGNKKITLGFLGGEAGGIQLEVSEMLIPELYERGIYFVEAPDRKLVHPLYGWSQGHLRLWRDPAGVDRVMTSAGMSIISVEPAAHAQAGKLSSGAARGLKLGRPDNLPAAIDKQTLKRQLRSLVKQP